MREYLLKDGKLFLSCQPETGLTSIKEKLGSEHEILFHHTFFFQENQIQFNDDEDSFRAEIGSLHDSLIELNPEVFSLKHRLYFEDNIQILDKYLLQRNISVVSALDDYAKGDTAIVMNDSLPYLKTVKNILPFSIFEELIKKFPTVTETYYYRLKAMDSIIGEFFDDLPDYLSKYEAYVSKHRKLVLEKPIYPQALEGSILQLEGIETELKALLADSSLSELEWQKRIANLILLLYPKYLVALTGVQIKDIDGNNRQLDFLLVDNEGNGDVLEIKKPFADEVMSNLTYRDNYYPKRELSGAVIQCEKYLYYLTGNKALNEKLINEKESENLKGLTVHITNPESLILVGRSNAFNAKQRQDFEIFRRCHKNITEILTYDDLLARVTNSLAFLKNAAKTKSAE